MANITHPDVRERYAVKIKLCESIDPYKLKESDITRNYDDLPNISYIDLFNYFVLTTSTYSKDEMCAFKSLDAYKHFASGWVTNVCVKTIPNDKRIVLGTVLHSMRLSLKPLKPWVLCENNGRVITAHCTCIAGLGEMCSHVGATLYAVESMVRYKGRSSKTDVLCQWNRPTQNTAIIKNTPIRQMDFTIKPRVSRTHSSGLVPFSKEEIYQLGQDLKEKTKKISSFSSVTKGLNDEFNVLNEPDEPIQETNNESCAIVTHPQMPEKFSSGLRFVPCDVETARALPMFMVNMYYNSEYKEMNLAQLLEISKTLNYRLTDDDIKFIEKLTVKQSKSWHWGKFRVGRITGSTFKKACVTQVAKPAISTIMRICYPEKTMFTSPAIRYGSTWEDFAKKQFDSEMITKHKNYSCRKTGLIVSKTCHFLAVSPDGIIHCSCHGKSILEIKCPYVLHPENATAEKLLNMSSPYIKVQDNEYCLVESHEYYFQVQMQMALCDCQLAFFNVWSKQLTITINVEFNQKFWNENSVKAFRFAKFLN